MTCRALTVLARALTLGATLAGCAARPQPLANPLPFHASEYADLFEAAAGVLRDQGLDLNRQDYRFGVISTEPVHAPTALEPWHGLHASGEQALTSTLHQERRQITLSFERLEGQGEGGTGLGAPDPSSAIAYQLRSEVVVERQYLPTRRLSGSTIGRQVLSQLSAVPAEWQERGIEPAYWRPLGRDPLMEQRLLAAIIERTRAAAQRAEGGPGP